MRTLLRLVLLSLITTGIAWADSTMLAVQQQLKREGFYDGTVDGVNGSQTAAAIRRYQLAKNLKVTGTLNEQTLRSLGFAPAPAQRPAPRPVVAKPAATPVPEYVAIADIFSGGPYISAGPEMQIATIRQAQKNLKVLGFYSGPINGSPTSAFVAALKAWQRDAGFRQTGRFDESTLKGLSLMPN